MLQATDFQTIARQAAQFVMPEGILTLFACAALVLDVMLPRNRKGFVAWVSLAGVGFAFVSLWILYSGIVTKGAPRTAFYDMIVLDSYAVVFKSMFLIGAALSILLSMKYLDVEGELRAHSVLRRRHDVHGVGRRPADAVHLARVDGGLGLHTGRLLPAR